MQIAMHGSNYSRAENDVFGMKLKALRSGPSTWPKVESKISPCSKALEIQAGMKRATKATPGASTRRKNDAVQPDPFFRNNPLPMWIYDADTLHFLDVNAAAIKTYGYTRRAFLALSLPEIVQHSVLPGKRSKADLARIMGVRGAAQLQVCRKNGPALRVQASTRSIDFQGHKAQLTTMTAAEEPAVTASSDLDRQNAEKALQESETNYRLLFDAAPIGIILTDTDGKILVFNDAILAQGGYSREDMVRLGSVVKLCADPAQRVEMLALLEQQGHLSKHEVQFKRKDGSVYDVLLTVTGLEIQGKRRLQAFVEDISQRRAAEEALRRSESLFRELFNNSPEGMFRTTPEGRFLSANAALVQMLGCESESEILAMNVSDFYVAPEVRAHNLDTLLETGELRDAEIRLKRRDGETLIALENSRSVRDGSGHVILLDGILTDITERKRMEEALRVSETELRSLFDAIPDLVLVLDEHGRYLRIVPGHDEMLLAPAQELLGRTLHDMLSQAQADQFIGHIQTALRTQRPLHIEYAIKVRSQTKWFSAAVAPLTAHSVVWVARDTTPQKQAEESMQRRLLELEALHESGLALGKTLDPSEICRQIIDVLSNRLQWHHAAVRMRRGDTEDVELMAFSAAAGSSSDVVSQDMARDAVTKVGQGMAGWVLRHGRMINSGNLDEDPRYRPVFPDMHSGLYVPIWAGGRVVACVSVESHERDCFTEADERLLTTLATQAAAALENARLFSETQRRMSETQSLYEFTRDLTAHFHLENLLKALARMVASLLNVAGGAAYLFDAETQALEMVMGTDDSLPIGTRLKVGEGMAGRVALTREAMVVEDYQAWDERPAQFQNRPWRAVMEVPMTYRGELIGVLAAYELHSDDLPENGQGRKFTDDDVRLLSLLGASAAGAIYSARLFDAERMRREEAEELRSAAVRSAERLSSLHAVTRELARISQDPEEVYASIHQAAARLLPVEAFVIALVDERRQTIHGAYLFDRDGRSPAMDIPYGESFTSSVISSGKTILLKDVESIGLNRIHFGTKQHVRSILAVPLRVGGQIIGMLSVQNYAPDVYQPDDEVLLEMLGAQAAIAIQNARLYQQALRSAERQSVLHHVSQSLARLSQDAEQLYAEIHAAAGQLMTADVFTITLLDERNDHLQAVYAMEQGRRWPILKFPAQEGFSGWVLKNKQTLFLSDSHESEIQRFAPFDDSADTRSVLMVPLLVGEQMLGAMSVQSYQPDQYTDEDQTILEMLGSQAAIAIQNSRLFEDARRRAQQFEVLHEATRELSKNQQDISSLLAALVNQAARLLGAYGSGMYLYDVNRGDLEMAVVSEGGEGTGARVKLGEGAAGRVAETRTPLLIEDYQSWEGRRSLHEGTPFRALVQVPMVYGGELIGVLDVFEYGDSERKFTQADVQLLTLFASQAAAAVHTARLFGQVSQRAGEFEALYQIAADISSQTDLPTLLNTVIDRATHQMGAAGSDVYLWDPDEQNLVLEAANDPDHRPGERLKLGEGLSGRVAAGKQPIIVEDYQTWEGRVSLYNGLPITSAIGVPMLYGGQLIGVLTAFNRPDVSDGRTAHTFTTDDASLLELLANSAAGAVYVARLLERTRRRVEQLSALHAVDTAIGSTTDLRVSLQAVLESVMHQLGADAADVLLLNPSTLALQYTAGSGFFTSEINHTNTAIGLGRAGKAVLERQIMHVPDLTAPEAGFTRPSLVAAERLKAYVAVPLIAKGEIKGVLEVFYRAPFEFDDERRSLLEVLGGQAALAIDNAQLFEGLEKANLELTMAYDATIEGWSQALELRDQETQGHSNRVLELTLKLAGALSVPERQMRDLRRGVLLHDIGKMGIPDAILHKPGPLTVEEWEVMQQHPRYAYDMLSPIVYLRNSLDIPYAHHEKWDGTGYPRGLKADSIPLLARIFSVADVYDALTSNRPYRGAWSDERALQYILEQSGKRFDPQVVEAFFKLLRG